MGGMSMLTDSMFFKGFPNWFKSYSNVRWWGEFSWSFYKEGLLLSGFPEIAFIPRPGTPFLESLSIFGKLTTKYTAKQRGYILFPQNSWHFQIFFFTFWQYCKGTRQLGIDFHQICKFLQTFCLLDFNQKWGYFHF